MGTVAEKLNKVLRTKADIKAAITEKGQNVGDVFSTYADKIRAIETGKDVSGVTATAADVLSPKVFVDSSGAKITGTIASKTESDLTVSGATVTVPAGHYASQATKSVAAATQATPSISVDSDGKITASATQNAGYVASGTKSATKQLTTQAAKTVTPGKSDQTAIAAGTYTTGVVTVKGDANLTASNIKSGVSIFGVSGSVEEVVTPTINVNSSGLITATAGTKSATKQLTTQAAKTITPGTSDQTAVSSGAYTTGAVTVKGDANLVPANIVEGKTIFGKTGTAEPASALADELTTQDNLIAQIMTALEGKAAGGDNSNYLNANEEVF